MTRPITTTDAIDILDDACAMLTFLQEIVPSAAFESKNLQLSEPAATGLSFIIADINAKIDNARSLL